MFQHLRHDTTLCEVPQPQPTQPRRTQPRLSWLRESPKEFRRRPGSECPQPTSPTPSAAPQPATSARPGESSSLFFWEYPSERLREPGWSQKNIARETGPKERERTSWPVSRILFPGALRRSRSAAIHLDPPSPTGSVQPTRRHRTGSPRAPAVWSCSGWGLPSRAGRPVRWWSLTPPFHPYSVRLRVGAVCFLWHCPASRPGLPLTTTLPCGVRTFLGGAAGVATGSRRRDRPASSSAVEV